jgi:hypothetical protein
MCKYRCDEKTLKIKLRDLHDSYTLGVLDGIPGVVPDLVPGIQGCKSPGSGKTWDQAKSLKFILIDSNFLISPVLRSPVFSKNFFFFQKGFFSKNTLQGFPGVRKMWEQESPSCLPRTERHLSKT